MLHNVFFRRVNFAGLELTEISLPLPLKCWEYALHIFILHVSPPLTPPNPTLHLLTPSLLSYFPKITQLVLLLHVGQSTGVC